MSQPKVSKLMFIYMVKSAFVIIKRFLQQYLGFIL